MGCGSKRWGKRLRISYTNHQGDYGRTYSQTWYQSLQVQQLKSEGSATTNKMLYLFHSKPFDSESQKLNNEYTSPFIYAHILTTMKYTQTKNIHLNCLSGYLLGKHIVPFS